jgi:hypothetical protein
VLEHERPTILSEVHKAIVGGHYIGKEIAQNIMCIELWWPTLHKDAKEYLQACDIFQRVGNPSRRDEIPLHAQVTLQDFEKWETKFIGLINPSAKKSGARYIIPMIKYLTRREEVKAVTERSENTAT